MRITGNAIAGSYKDFNTLIKFLIRTPHIFYYSKDNNFWILGVDQCTKQSVYYPGIPTPVSTIKKDYPNAVEFTSLSTSAAGPIFYAGNYSDFKSVANILDVRGGCLYTQIEGYLQAALYNTDLSYCILYQDALSPTFLTDFPKAINIGDSYSLPVSPIG